MNSTVKITYDSNNPNARLAINFIKTLDCLTVTKVKQEKTSETKSDSKEIILAEMRNSRDEAKKIMNGNRKGHTIAEILETI